MSVKPLQWVRYENALCAPTRLRADYWVHPRNGRWEAVATFFMGASLHDTERQAMEACQRNFEAEVAAMIEG